MTMKKDSIYISGPMTGYDDLNFPAFYQAVEVLHEAGWPRQQIVNPARFPCEPRWEENLCRDLAVLAQECSTVFVLPGWMESEGAVGEVAVAQFLGMMVCDTVNEDYSLSAIKQEVIMALNLTPSPRRFERQ